MFTIWEIRAMEGYRLRDRQEYFAIRETVEKYVPVMEVVSGIVDVDDVGGLTFGRRFRQVMGRHDFEVIARAPDKAKKIILRVLTWAHLFYTEDNRVWRMTFDDLLCAIKEGMRI